MFSMKIWMIAVLFLFAAPKIHGHSQSLPSLEVQTNCEHDPNTFRCVKYVKNYDGDTITVDIPNVHPLIGDKITVRVREIDTPEMRGKHPCEKASAIVAQRFTAKLLKAARHINLKNVGRDKYFRILATVEADGIVLKDALMAHHLAYAYNGKAKQEIDWCAYTKTVP